MGKKFNYFDDEAPKTKKRISIEARLRIDKLAKASSDNQPADADKSVETASADDSLGRKIRYVLSVIGVNVKLIFKSLFKKASSSQSTRAKQLVSLLLSLIVVVLTIVLTVTVVMVSANRVNSRQEKFNKAAAEVCAQYVDKYGIPNYKYMNSEYDVKGCMLIGVCVAREMDFDNDGMPELLLAYNDGDVFFEDVWGFDGDEFKKLYSKMPAQSDDKKDDMWISIYSTGKEYYLAEHDDKDMSKVNMLALHKGKFKQRREATYVDKNQGFTMKGKDVTDSFERIKFSVLRESYASIVVDRTLDTIDSFSNEPNKVKTANTVVNNAMDNEYYKIVSDYNSRFGVATYETGSGNFEIYLNGLAVVDLVDFDSDGTNELVLIYRRGVNKRSEDAQGNYISVVEYNYFCDIYSWNGSVAKLVYQDEGLSNMLNDDSTIYYLIKNDGKKKYLCTNSFKKEAYGNTVHATSKILRFNGDAFVQKLKASYETEYGYTEYYIDDEYVYKSTFEDRGGYSVPFFDGSESYDSSIWRVTYLQGKPVKSSALKNQITKTEETIKSLYPAYNPSNVEKSN